MYVLPIDTFEWIAKRLRDSTQSNAAFGDSHVAAVSDFNTSDFVNLGIGATTIRKMSSRVHFYFEKNTPGEVIIQADPHLFADYRLEPQGSYIPEVYSESRLRVFDPRHRSFIREYWSRLLSARELKEKEITSYDKLWEGANNRKTGGERGASEPDASAPKPEPPTPQQDSGDSALAKHQLGPAKSGASLPAPPNVEDTTSTEFEAFMDYEVRAHTPVTNFKERDEARIYRQMIDFLISRGAKVCLVNYPVDTFYRQRADAIPVFAEVREFYRSIALEKHIPYVSFWDRFDDPSIYQNTDHVNQKGSAILAPEARRACFGKPG